MERFVRWCHRVSDDERCWLGFQHLKPAPHQPITWRRALGLAALIGVGSTIALLFVGFLLLTALSLAWPEAPVLYGILTPRSLVAGALGGGMQLIGAWCWNRRASTLAEPGDK